MWASAGAQQRSQQRQRVPCQQGMGTIAKSSWAYAPREQAQRKQPCLIIFPLVHSDPAKLESSGFKFLKRPVFYKVSHWSFAGVCMSPRSERLQEVQKMSICTPTGGDLSKIWACLLPILFRQWHGDFCRYVFFPVCVSYEAGPSSLCDKGSRREHTRSRWPWGTYHHRPLQHLVSHLEHRKEGTESLESHGGRNTMWMTDRFIYLSSGPTAQSDSSE